MTFVIFEKLKLNMSRNEILDHNFLATINRSWIDLGSGKIPNLEPLDLSGPDRGVVQGEIVRRRRCTVRFLRCIKFNLLALLLTYIGSSPLDAASQENLHEFLDNGDPDIKRLHQHPELFPNKIIGELFFYDIYKIGNLLLQECMTKMDNILELRDKVLQETKNDFNTIFMPKRDETRKLWQQYFHNNAPGSGIHPPPRIEGACTQIMPVGACELFLTWKEERQALATRMNIVEPGPTPNANATAGPRRVKLSITPDGNERASWMAVNCLPPLPRISKLRKARDMMVSDPTSLERLNEVFSNLKGSQRRLWPSTMQRTCYVIQERHPAGFSSGPEQGQGETQTQTQT